MRLYKTEVIRHAGPWRSLDDMEYATLEWVAVVQFDAAVFKMRRVRPPPSYASEQFVQGDG
jgi:hypothetical protein